MRLPEHTQEKSAPIITYTHRHPAPQVRARRGNNTTQQNIPVTTLTWAIPWESRRMTPIWEGVAPFLASLQIWSTTWSGVVLSHEGALRL